MPLIFPCDTSLWKSKVRFIISVDPIRCLGLSKIERMNGEDDQDHDGDSNNMLLIERPQSWIECIKMLLTIKVRKLFKVSNPDGYFYLYFLKRAALFFFISKQKASYSYSTTLCRFKARIHSNTV
jgi:hypothetical protein